MIITHDNLATCANEIIRDGQEAEAFAENTSGQVRKDCLNLARRWRALTGQPALSSLSGFRIPADRR